MAYGEYVRCKCERCGGGRLRLSEGTLLPCLDCEHDALQEAHSRVTELEVEAGMRDAEVGRLRERVVELEGVRQGLVDVLGRYASLRSWGRVWPGMDVWAWRPDRGPLEPWVAAQEAVDQVDTQGRTQTHRDTQGHTGGGDGWVDRALMG